MGKVQLAPLPLALVVAAAVAAATSTRSERARRLRPLVPIALAAVCGIALQWHQVTRTDEPWLGQWRRVALFNTVVNGILGSSTDPAATAAAIGVSPDCARHAGRSVFDFADRAAAWQSCPGLDQTSRAAILLRLLVHEPGTAVRLVVRAVGSVHPWVQRELGHVAGRPYGDVTREWFSFGPFLERHAKVALALLFAPALYVLLGCVVARLRAGDLGLVWLGAWASSAVIGQLLVTTAFGDGVQDLSRQAFLVLDAALAFAIGTSAAGLGLALLRLPHRVRDDVPRTLRLGATDPAPTRATASHRFHCSRLIRSISPSCQERGQNR